MRSFAVQRLGWVTLKLTMKDKKFYAHFRDGKSPEDWHRLENHLNEVARMARRFANEFNAGDWGYLAGLTHRSGIETKRL